jgi:Non-ribosomal peptide synthetase modules and related proteins
VGRGAERSHGQDTVVFGMVVAGWPADLDGVEEAVGLFLTTIPTPVALGADPTRGDLARQVQRPNTGCSSTVRAAHRSAPRHRTQPVVRRPRTGRAQFDRR